MIEKRLPKQEHPREKTMKKHLSILGATAALIASSFAGAASAQTYPTKPVNIIVGFGAGGGTDAVVRAVAEPMSKSLGQPVLVQNKPGAGGGVAAMTIKSAEPDGYTLIATGSL